MNAYDRKYKTSFYILFHKISSYNKQCNQFLWKMILQETRQKSDLLMLSENSQNG